MPQRPKVCLFDHSPHLKTEWVYERNPIDPEIITYASNKKVWWSCINGHLWEAKIQDRSERKTGCSVCSNKVVLRGYNDLWSTDPDLAEQMADPEVGYEVTRGSGRKVSWVCDRGHTWDALVNGRANLGRGCHYCTGYKVIEGLTDLWSTDSELASQLVDTEIGYTVSRGSNKRVQWLCPSGHTWDAVVHKRVEGHGCPICSGQRVCRGVNDLWTIAPQLAAQLLEPEDGYIYTTGSNKKVFWECESGHVWDAPIGRRFSGAGCPYCSNNKVLRGYNDLWTVVPEIANQLVNPEVGYGLTVSSGRKAFWKCAEGHIWLAVTSSRTRGHGCPDCCLRHTSIIEGRLRELLSNQYTVLSKDHRYRVPVAWRKNKSMSVDIYMETPHKVVIEYDGSYHHTKPNSLANDLDKTNALLSNGYFVIRVRESTKKLVLPYVDIDHPNLLQLSVPYLTTDDNLIEAVDQIKQWLESKND